MRVECTCEQCGRPFQAYAFLGRRFCSRSCRSRWTNANVPRRLRSAPRTTQPCMACDAPVTRLVSHVRGAVCCSPSCARELMRRGESRSCETCAARFYIAVRRIKEGQPGRFCSVTCRAVWQNQQPRKSRTRDSADNRDWRTAVFARDNYTCQRCSQRGGHLNAHHIKGWTRYPEFRFDLDNGLTLCGPCHVAWHQEHGWG